MLDREMREPLFDYLDENFGKIRIIEEKTIQGSRADVLGVLDGYFVGFEIKSDQDTYTRLKTQVKDYDKFCDFCYIVVGASHRKHVAEHIPEHWGILVVTADGVELDRGADDNPEASLLHQITLMWKRELFQLLDMNGCPKYRAKSRAFLRGYLLEHIAPELLKKQMTDLIFERDYTIFDPKQEEISGSGTGGASKDGKKGEGEKGKGKTAGKKRKTVRAKKAIRRMNSSTADRKRAHTTNYVGKKRKTRKKKNPVL